MKTSALTFGEVTAIQTEVRVKYCVDKIETVWLFKQMVQMFTAVS